MIGKFEKRKSGVPLTGEYLFFFDERLVFSFWFRCDFWIRLLRRPSDVKAGALCLSFHTPPFSSATFRLQRKKKEAMPSAIHFILFGGTCTATSLIAWNVQVLFNRELTLLLTHCMSDEAYRGALTALSKSTPPRDVAVAFAYVLETVRAGQKACVLNALEAIPGFHLYLAGMIRVPDRFHERMAKAKRSCGRWACSMVTGVFAGLALCGALHVPTIHAFYLAPSVKSLGPFVADIIGRGTATEAVCGAALGVFIAHALLKPLGCTDVERMKVCGRWFAFGAGICDKSPDDDQPQ